MDDMDKQPQKLQSNEEVIEELTRDLKSSYSNVNKDTAQNITSDIGVNRNITADSWDVIDKEHEESDSNDAQSTDFLEDIDEELLKDREINLTEAEKEVYIVKYLYIIVKCYIMLHPLSYFYRH